MNEDAEKEFKAIQTIHAALVPLEKEGCKRVLTYIISLLDINIKTINDGSRTVINKNNDDDLSNKEEDQQVTTGQENQNISNFAELYALANPKTNGDKSLLAGYWLQICQNQENFTAAAANKELTNLGHKITNITDAINTMKNQKPVLILQLKKSGASKQARKLYKVSHEGIKHVEEMLHG